jgi:predicted metalloendopeptidase
MMAWAFAFEAPHGVTIKSSRFMWITHFDSSVDLWWAEDLRKWTSTEEIQDTNSLASNGVRCRSFKAFKRHLRKHPELQQLDEVILVSRYIGYNIKAKWVNQ